MNKLEMVMQMIIAEVSRVGICSIDSDKVLEAWKLADTMQAESDKREDKTRPAVLQEKWQPDWSVAPDWANWWVMDADGDAAWCEEKPIKAKDFWYGKEGNSSSFNYQGNWQDSLRKRPSNK